MKTIVQMYRMNMRRKGGKYSVCSKRVEVDVGDTAKAWKCEINDVVFSKITSKRILS